METSNERYHGTTTDASLVSGVSWAAIFAGALAAAAITLILIVLGSGLGFSSISPWSGEGVGAKTLGISAILWITFISLAASALGGYLAGRLRVKWSGVHTDEVYFRDTAHGFLSWALATLLTATLMASAVTTAISGGVQAGTAVVGGITSAASQAVSAGASAVQNADIDSEPLEYFWDALFRREGGTRSSASDDDTQSSPSNRSRPTISSEQKSEVVRIFVHSLGSGSLSDRDTRYVTQIISQYTGISEQEATRRVRETYETVVQTRERAEQEIKEAADAAAKAAAYASLWVFISLLAGAFVASLSATWGGRQRDR